MAIQPLLLKPWPYRGPIAIIEKNPEHGVFSISYIDQWACVLSENHPLEAQDSHLQLLSEDDLSHYPRVFDRDSYRIIRKALKNKSATTIVALG